MPPDPAEPASQDAEAAALLDRVVAGDDAARLQFFDAHAPKVDRFVRFTFGLGYDDAADVVQETMITAFKIIAGFDRTRPVVSWLFGIAKMKVRTLRRDWARVPVPWSTAARESRGRQAGPEIPSARQVESALGDRAAVPGADQASDGVARDEEAGTTPGRRTPPPAPPHTDGVTSHAAWAREIRAWLETQPQEAQIIARRFTRGATFAQLTADLGAHTGKPVTEAAARQRASRFAHDFARRFGQVLPRSRVRLTDTEDARRPTDRRRRPARVGAGE